MIGAIVGAIGSQVVGGVLNNVLGGGKGGGLLEGIGGIAKNLLDPIGLFSGKESNGEAKELMGMLRELIQELMALLKEKGMGGDTASKATGGHSGNTSPSKANDTKNAGGHGSGPLHINGGSGDDVIIVRPTRPAPDTPTPSAPVAANEHGRIWGDPHFVGGDGGKYDVQGEVGKIYDLLSDSNLQLRGQFHDWGNGTTAVGETGLTVTDPDTGKSSNINFRKDGTARINGRQMEEGQLYSLADGGTAKLEGKTLTITTAEGYTIKQEAKGKGGKAHINIDVHTGANGVDNGQMPGGLLGQTFDADSLARDGKRGKGAQGEGAITGRVQDYEVPALDPMNDDRGRHTDEIDELPENQPIYIDGGSGDDTIIVG